DHIKSPRKDGLNFFSVNKRHSQLLCSERRQPPRAARETIYLDVGVCIIVRRGFLTSEKTVGVLVVNNSDTVPALRKFVRERLDIHAVPAKVIRRIERRNHAKTE